MSSGGMSGPPTHQDHIPSNLEVEQASWETKVWTGSPVWKPEEKKESPKMADVIQVANGVKATVCYDEATSKMKLSASVDLTEGVWVAISFRKEKKCMMTPKDGSDGEVVFTSPGSQGSYDIKFGPMAKTLKSFNTEHMRSFMTGLEPLSECANFSDFSTEYSGGKLSLSFSRKYAAKPDTFYLAYAFGQKAELSYHSSRGCFEASPAACPNEMNTGKCPECPKCRFSGVNTSGTTVPCVLGLALLVALAHLSEMSRHIC